MIQQESMPVWGYGRGQVRTVARATRVNESPADLEVIGPMLFTYLGSTGSYRVTLDVAGPTAIRYCCARILHSSNDDLQAQVVVDPSATPLGSQLLVQIWDVNPGPPDTPASLSLDAALSIEVIVDQTGALEFSYGPQLAVVPPPVPAPLPDPPPARLPPPPRVP